MTDDIRTIYSQRYETFRHLDKLRWQMFQILVAIGSATALVLRSTRGEIEPWFFQLIGVSLIVVAFSMWKISLGIRGNARALQKAAVKIGDSDIPNVKNVWTSVAHYIELLVSGLGIYLIIFSFTK